MERLPPTEAESAKVIVLSPSAKCSHGAYRVLSRLEQLRIVTEAVKKAKEGKKTTL